jgi:hypothetical protein
MRCPPISVEIGFNGKNLGRAGACMRNFIRGARARVLKRRRSYRIKRGDWWLLVLRL